MANEIKSKYSSITALTITLASLASSTAGVGRQSTIVDNTTTRYQEILLSVKIKLGTSPTSNKSVQVYLIRDNNDSTPIRDDGAGATDAGITILNAPLIGVLNDSSSAATGDVLSGNFLIVEPGQKWGIAVVQDTGVNLDSTGANHVISYTGINPEIQ